MLRIQSFCVTLLLQSAYEMKDNCCIFRRLFKIEKNGVLEILAFLYYANQLSDDVILKIISKSTRNEIFF